jgi:hypothetical protein
MFDLPACIGGLFVGLFISSCVESFFHEYIGHASPWLLECYARIPVVGQWLAAAAFRHKITHHGLTYKIQTEQFSAERPMSAVDALIANSGKDNLADTKTEDYGRTLNAVGLIKFSIPFVLVLGVIYRLLSVWITSATFLCSLLAMFPTGACVSKWLHPCFHLPYDATTGRMKTKSRLLDFYMNSRFGRFLWVYHDMHHHSARGMNFNLMLFGFLPAGDRVRGRVKWPTDKDHEHAAQEGGPPLWLRRGFEVEANKADKSD